MVQGFSFARSSVSAVDTCEIPEGKERLGLGVYIHIGVQGFTSFEFEGLGLWSLGFRAIGVWAPAVHLNAVDRQLFQNGLLQGPDSLE